MTAKKFTLRTVFGIAKSKELQLTDDELHLIVESHTGKSSLKELNDKEIQVVVRELSRLKDRQKRNSRAEKYNRGNQSTINQRKKIYRLTEELGWNTNSARLSGFVKRMFGVTAVEWLNYEQCSKLIEALKGMIERENKKLQADN